MSELDRKLEKITALLDARKLDALYLQRVSSFAWITGGAASYINTASTTGEATLLITKNARYVITNNIEAPHYDKEEHLKAQGWDFQVGPWFQPSDALDRLAGGLRLGADMCMAGAQDLSGEIAELRMNLEPEEQQRFREVARLSAEAMNAAIRAVRPGMNEYEIAGLLAKETFDRKVQPIVNLVATDQRIYDFRHPLPQDKPLEKYAMLVLCGRKYGLVASVTRLVHFGPLPDDLKRKQKAVIQVDAQVIAGTLPGATLGEMFGKIEAAYASAGFPGEYQLHHQGGPAGYEAREIIAKPGVAARVAVGQTYAWNPSITGIKVEDTILLTEGGFEILTAMPGWPAADVQTPAGTVRRPLVLEA